jgi:hypothetical protein
MQPMPHPTCPIFAMPQRGVLLQLLAAYETRDAASARCGEFELLLHLTIQAHALLPMENWRTPAMVALTNAAYGACGLVAQAMGRDYRTILADGSASIDALWDLVMASITFTDAQLIPSLDLPGGRRPWRRPSGATLRISAGCGTPRRPKRRIL